MTRPLLWLMLLLAVICLAPLAAPHDPLAQNPGKVRLPASFATYPGPEQTEALVIRQLRAAGLSAATIEIEQGRFVARFLPGLPDMPGLTDFLDEANTSLTGWTIAQGDDGTSTLSGGVLYERHLLGTDSNGRDILSRLMHGLRNTALFAGMVVVFALAVGLGVGLVAGLAPRWVDAAIMRLSEGIYAFPAFFIVVLCTLYLGASPLVLASAIALIEAPDAIRYVRGGVLSLRAEGFVTAAHALGASPGHIALRHISPNLVSLLLPMAAIVFARAVALESTLSYLALGLQEPTVTLGKLIAETVLLAATRPLPLIFSAATLCVLLAAFVGASQALRVQMSHQTRYL